MAKNGSAAKAQDGGKAQGTTVPSNGGQVPATATLVGESAPESVLPADVASSLSINSTQGLATQADGNQAPNSGSDTATQPASDSTADFSGANNSAVVVGIGESFAKTLAASLQNTHGLKVTSKQAGFRRAGHAWNTTPTVIALSELTDDQVLLLKGEPMLTVQMVDLDDEDA